MMSSKSNKNMFLLIAVVVVAALGVLYIFIPDSGNSTTENAPVSSARPAAESSDDTNEFPLAPDFALKDVEGNTVKLSDYRGKVVFVNFWATWCPPCRAEIPHFVELVDELKDDFIVLGISVDRENDLPKIPDFVKSYNINYPVLYADQQISAYGNISSIPTTFVVDKEGYVKGKIVGSRPKAEFERIITAEL